MKVFIQHEVKRIDLKHYQVSAVVGDGNGSEVVLQREFRPANRIYASYKGLQSACRLAKAKFNASAVEVVSNDQQMVNELAGISKNEYQTLKNHLLEHLAINDITLESIRHSDSEKIA